MYDKCYFCLDQLPKLKKESTASFFVNFGGAGVQKSQPTLLYMIIKEDWGGCCGQQSPGQREDGKMSPRDQPQPVVGLAYLTSGEQIIQALEQSPPLSFKKVSMHGHDEQSPIPPLQVHVRVGTGLPLTTPFNKSCHCFQHFSIFIIVFS